MATMNDLYLNFLFQKMTYIMVVRVTKFHEDRQTVFEIFGKNPQGAILPPFPQSK